MHKNILFFPLLKTQKRKKPAGLCIIFNKYVGDLSYPIAENFILEKTEDFCITS